MEGELVKKFTIGVRGIPNHHRDQMKKYGVECVEMRHYTPSLPFVFDTPLYLSIDIDAIDPAHAPGRQSLGTWRLYLPGGKLNFSFLFLFLFLYQKLSKNM